MEDRIEDLLSSCYEIKFGELNISQEEKQFCTEFDNELISLCKSLPESTQTDGLLFLMRCFRTPFGVRLNFLKYFCIPAWSILYWLIQSSRDSKELEQKDVKNAKTAHSMAIFLHALDDHLNDHELPATHLVLLLRSQSWMIMNNALKSLANGVDGGEEIVQGLIDDYYSSIRGSEETESLDSYCALFRKQMATWLAVPILMTKKMSTDEKFSSAIHNAYGSFGVAWRLLDDIKDIETDMINGAHSAVYVCLSENMRNSWDRDAGGKGEKNSGYTRGILHYMLENSIIDRIKERICRELESAASVADEYNMTGLADEFRSLLRPLKNEQGTS